MTLYIIYNILSALVLYKLDPASNLESFGLLFGFIETTLVSEN